MTTLHHEIKINAPLEKVWQILANLEAVQYYNPMVKSARYISANKEGVGAARHCDFKDGKFVKERVTEWEPKKAMTIEMYEHQWPIKFMRWRTELHAEGNGTMATQDLEYEMKFGILGKLMNALIMRKKMDQGAGGVFQEFKRYVESAAK